jgi:putative endonuclease
MSQSVDRNSPTFLYILHSQSIDQFYIGITHDVDQRLYYHNNGNKGWTKRGRPWRLVFTQMFPGESSAKKAEKVVKNQKSKEFINKLIKNQYKL